MFKFNPLEILKFFKLSFKHNVIVVLVLSFARLSPINWLKTLSIDSIILKHMSIITVLWIISLVFLFVEFIVIISRNIREKKRIKFNSNLRIKRLKNLTTEEKKILMQYINNDTRTQVFKLGNGNIRELEKYEIVSRASDLALRFDLFSFNIEDWAWDYLKKHPKLLR